jgi:hypothetical protein
MAYSEVILLKHRTELMLTPDCTKPELANANKAAILFVRWLFAKCP